MKAAGEETSARRQEICRRAGILLASDEATGSDSLRPLLRSQGYHRVEIVADPEAVIARVRESQPDLVVLDWDDTGLRNRELLRALPAETAPANYLPILVVSVAFPPELRNELLQDGANDVLLKPCDGAVLALRVANLLEIRFLHLEVEERIASQRRIEQELRKTKEEAEQLNAAKSEFLSRMSHELRTPLNAIIGFAQLADLDARTTEEHENVEQILRAGTHLLQLINEVLDVSHIEAGSVPMFLKPVPLQLAAKEALALVEPLAADRNVQLDQFRFNYYLRADGQRLQQVMLNLLSNAIKFNKPGGHVTLACRETSRDMLRVEVSDTGMGIESYELPRLFQPFQRLDASTDEAEGIGLGLVICQRLIRLMGGTMGVESERGVGSTFWFELPVARSMPDMDEGSDRAISDRRKSYPAVTKTLLYIEDNLPNLKLIERILAQRPGIRMITAQQGSLGLELARQHQPDLLLLDLHLPDMNGDQVLIWLKSEPRTAHIPVVVISADALGREIERLKKLGARAYITKPFEVAHFLQVLDEILATSELRPA